MAGAAKRTLPSPLWKMIRAYGTAILTPIRFSRSSGHWRSSLAGRAFCCCGKPLPWYSYPAIDFLKTKDFAGKRVLEFGAGQSTLWWGERAGEVVSVEADAEWFADVCAQVPGNVTLHHCPMDRATRSIANVRSALAGQTPFDVIVVDGHLREECTELAIELLAPGGAIILDNAESGGYAFDSVLEGRGLQRVDFHGFSPGVRERQTTALVFRDRCFLL